ncbi:hypothetical protein PHSC3_001759 [Chlamydiales bacterium STE3]|nr:hypothetical protein PHSC3_001759 [Chlamydiales bacterium STE3]
MDLNAIYPPTFPEKFEKSLLIEMEKLCDKNIAARCIPFTPLVVGVHTLGLLATVAQCYVKGIANVFGALYFDRCNFKWGIKILTVEVLKASLELIVLPFAYVCRAVQCQWKILFNGQKHIKGLIDGLKEEQA